MQALLIGGHELTAQLRSADAVDLRGYAFQRVHQEELIRGAAADRARVLPPGLRGRNGRWAKS
jgi:hypothetical protein